LNSTAAALLGLLRQRGPMNGNALTLTAKAAISDYWTVTRSQVYRELNSLRSRGLVSSGPLGPRESRDLSVTETGNAAFLSWLAAGPADDVIRMPLLLTVRFGADLPPGRLAEILEKFSSRHRKTLERYRQLQADLAGTPVDDYAIATLRFGIAFEEAIQRWIEELPSVIDVPCE
jgi:DNA-binding PadR family transcriptional regulator